MFIDDFFLSPVSFQLLRGKHGAGGYWVLLEFVLCQSHTLKERRVQEIKVSLEHLYLYVDWLQFL